MDAYLAELRKQADQVKEKVAGPSGAAKIMAKAQSASDTRKKLLGYETTGTQATYPLPPLTLKSITSATKLPSTKPSHEVVLLPNATVSPTFGIGMGGIQMRLRIKRRPDAVPKDSLVGKGLENQSGTGGAADLSLKPKQASIGGRLAQATIKGMKAPLKGGVLAGKKVRGAAAGALGGAALGYGAHKLLQKAYGGEKTAAPVDQLTAFLKTPQGQKMVSRYAPAVAGGLTGGSLGYASAGEGDDKGARTLVGGALGAAGGEGLRRLMAQPQTLGQRMGGKLDELIGKAKSSGVLRSALVGGGLGGGLGAAMGYSSKINSPKQRGPAALKGALLGAGAGALAGTGLGNYRMVDAAQMKRKSEMMQRNMAVLSQNKAKMEKFLQESREHVGNLENLKEALKKMPRQVPGTRGPPS